VFIVCRDARYGNLLHLPFAGGVYDQPCKTMDVLEQIRANFLEKLTDDQEKTLAGLHV